MLKMQAVRWFERGVLREIIIPEEMNLSRAKEIFNSSLFSGASFMTISIWSIFSAPIGCEALRRRSADEGRAEPVRIGSNRPLPITLPDIQQIRNHPHENRENSTSDFTFAVFLFRLKLAGTGVGQVAIPTRGMGYFLWRGSALRQRSHRSL
jgi:hypothetical protein